MGEFVKTCIITAMDCLLSKHKDKNIIINEIKAIPLSRRTVARRVNFIGQQIRDTLKQTIKNAVFWGICLDESTNRNNVAQLVVWIIVYLKNLKLLTTFWT